MQLQMLTELLTLTDFQTFCSFPTDFVGSASVNRESRNEDQRETGKIYKCSDSAHLPADRKCRAFRIRVVVEHRQRRRAEKRAVL